MVAPGRYRVPRQETFKVVRLLPQENGTWQYRTLADSHERVVLESELT